MKFIWFWSFLVVRVLAKTTVEKVCETLPKAFYHGHSCYVQNSDGAKDFNTSKAECETPKPNLPVGHLAHILTSETMKAILNAATEGTIDDIMQWIGLEQIPPDDEGPGGTKGWTWTHPTLPDRPTPHHDLIFWHPDPTVAHGTYEDDDVAAHKPSNAGFVDGRGDWAITVWYLCQYEEPYFRQYHRCFKNKIGHNTTFIAQWYGMMRIDCGQECASDMVCRSFSYNEVTGHCIIYWTDGFVANFGPVDKTQYNFYVSGYSYNRKTKSYAC